VLIGFVAIKVSETRTISGQEGSLARANSSGFVNHVALPIKMGSIVTSVGKSTSILESMLTSTERNGLIAIVARSGFTLSVRLKMVMKS
jgi:hypothetical protein